MTLVSRNAANNAKIPRKIFDEIEQTGHPLGVCITNIHKELFQNLWQGVHIPLDDPTRSLPSFLTKEWFVQTYCNSTSIDIPPTAGIWEHIEDIAAHDVIAMLAVSPMYLDRFFQPHIIPVNNTNHLIIGLTKMETGIKNQNELVSFITEQLLASLYQSSKFTNEEDRFNSLESY